MRRVIRSRATPEPTTLLREPLRRTLAGLWAERLARAFWPVSTLVLFTAAALGFGVQDRLPPVLMTWLLLGAGVLMLVALAVGLWRFSPPRRADALDRLDRSLPGRPLTALADAQVVGREDPASNAVWQAHLRRMTAVLVTARAVPGDLKLARFDPFALRYVALTGFALSVLFGAPSRVTEATGLAQIPGRAEAVALGPSWEAWAQPPSYTGRPSLYLNDVDRTALQLPEGTRVTVRFYGQPGVMSVVESLSGRTEPDPQNMAQDFEVLRSGRLSIRGPAGRDWEITMLEDQPPQVALAGVMERERGGLMRQEFRAQDDYGVTGGSAEIALDLDAVERRHGLAADPEPRAPIVLDLPMPMTGSRAEFSEALFGDLSQHPWANMPVTIALQVEDARGQTGETETTEVVLPGRRFFDPMAAAVIELRRDILWSRENAARADQLMRAIAHRPEDVFRSNGVIPRFRAAQALLQTSLRDGLDDDTLRDDLAQSLWDLAILLEEGDLADARERLRRAQERLEEAMRSGADPSEIAELMDELREAMRDYMQELAQQPRERGEAPPDGDSMEITQDQIQELLDRIQELMEQGRMEEAAELMAQLEMLLENLEFVEGDGQGGEGNEMMEGLGDTLREQQDLADDTFREFQDQFNRGPPGAQGEDEGEGAGAAPGADDLAERQRALRDMLRDQQLQPMPGEGTAEGEAALEALEDAQRAMEEAEEALREGDAAGALDRQAEAMEALREGMRQMNQAQAQDQRDRGEQGEAQADGGRDGSRDPLGRSLGGEVGTDDDMLQGEEARRRAQELLDELRRRSAELDRPEAELDYLRRLLDRF